jgi:hypothetical protein
LTARRLAQWAAHKSPATFIAFGLLELDGHVLADEPFIVRRDALQGLGLHGLRLALTPSDSVVGRLAGDPRPRPRGRCRQGPAVDVGAAADQTVAPVQALAA